MSVAQLKAPADFSRFHTASSVQIRAGLADARMKELNQSVKYFYWQIMANAPWSLQSVDRRVLFMTEVSARLCTLYSPFSHGVEGTGQTPVAEAVRECLAGRGYDAAAALQPLEGPPPQEGRSCCATDARREGRRPRP